MGDRSRHRRELFERDGYMVVEDLLGPDEIAWYRDVYDRLLSGEVDAGMRRGDLGAAAGRRKENVENITQSMWPSGLVEGLGDSVAYERARGFDHGKSGPGRENRNPLTR